MLSFSGAGSYPDGAPAVCCQQQQQKKNIPALHKTLKLEQKKKKKKRANNLNLNQFSPVPNRKC